MPVILLASFPNSRIKPRPATQEANTVQIALNFLGQPLTNVAPANLNRTYVILSNISQTRQFYIYADIIGINPTVVPLDGVTNEVVYDQIGNILYQKQDNGVTTNWVVVQIEDVGQVIDPGGSASLESLQNIWMAYDSGVAIVPTPEVDVDEGRG